MSYEHQIKNNIYIFKKCNTIFIIVSFLKLILIYYIFLKYDICSHICVLHYSLKVVIADKILIFFYFSMNFTLIFLQVCCMFTDRTYLIYMLTKLKISIVKPSIVHLSKWLLIICIFDTFIRKIGQAFQSLTRNSEPTKQQL